MWDTVAAQALNDPSIRARLSKFETVPTAGQGRRERCCEDSQTISFCPYPEYTLRIHSGNYYGGVLLRKTATVSCYVMKIMSICDVTFRRRDRNEFIRSLYSLRALQSHFFNFNSLFRTTQAFMNMSYVTGGGLSFFRFEGNASLAFGMQNLNNMC